MSPQEKKVWLVTGANSGLGLAITMSALQAGHRVLATARDTSKAAHDNPDVEKLGGSWVKLDVTDENTQHVVSNAIKEKADGKIDVVVSNAGYLQASSIEDARYECLLLLAVSPCAWSLKML